MLNILFTVLKILVILFLLTVIIYWFNLDTKAVKLLEKPMQRHYDKLERNKRI